MSIFLTSKIVKFIEKSEHSQKTIVICPMALIGMMPDYNKECEEQWLIMLVREILQKKKIIYLYITKVVCCSKKIWSAVLLLISP